MYDELVKRLREYVPTALVNCDFDFVEGWAKEAADAIESTNKAYQMMAEAYEAEVTKPRWIPVTERLPGTGEIVLVYGKRGGIYTAEHNRNARWPGSFWKLNSKSHHCEPTHWMKLPEPPKEERE